MTHDPPTRYIYRSSITGRYVTRQYAEDNPATTYRTKVQAPPG